VHAGGLVLDRRRENLRGRARRLDHDGNAGAGPTTDRLNVLAQRGINQKKRAEVGAV